MNNQKNQKIFTNTTSKKYSTWKQWNPNEYLNQYFTEWGYDTIETINFLIKHLSEFENKPVSKILDFGCGPTPIISLVVSSYAHSIHMVDYLYSNLFEIKKWLDGDKASFNWDLSIEKILKLQGKNFTRLCVANKKIDLVNKAKLLHCDASKKYPISPLVGKYPIVLSIFCPESATDSKFVWGQYMNNISNLIEPNGIFIVAALRNCNAYHIGNEIFPSANINENDLSNILSKNFIDIEIEIKNVPDCQHQGFESILLAKAIKSNNIKNGVYV